MIRQGKFETYPSQTTWKPDEAYAVLKQPKTQVSELATRFRSLQNFQIT